MTPLSRLLTHQRQTALRLLKPSAASLTTSSLRSSAGAIRFLSTGGDNITYSGGQATEGQGGYYGSGGARVISPSDSNHGSAEDRQAVLAIASDVQKITSVMDELDMLESLLRREEEEQAASPTKTVTPKLIELKASIKKLMTAPDVVETLKRLEIEGEPVWGLSSDEREMIILAREKVNEC